jgi:MPBQ/MSBQ methyltransferase
MQQDGARDEARIVETTASLASRYDRAMFDPLQAAFFGNSDYYNYGYSTNETDSQRQACENLVERLLAFIPDNSGSILDVACGLGASTRHLLRYYQPGDVTATNISERQLERARHNAPGCRFLKMDAVALDFPDASFDNVICVESAFHFRTREQFLREALRVLKPGGRLVLSDILGRFTRKDDANYLEGPPAYAALLAKTGFENVEVLDATDNCSRSCGRRLRRWPGVERRAGRLGLPAYLQALLLGHLYSLYMLRSQRYYLLCSAQKPATSTPA